MGGGLTPRPTQGIDWPMPVVMAPRESCEVRNSRDPRVSCTDHVGPSRRSQPGAAEAVPKRLRPGINARDGAALKAEKESTFPCIHFRTPIRAVAGCRCGACAYSRARAGPTAHAGSGITSAPNGKGRAQRSSISWRARTAPAHFSRAPRDSRVSNLLSAKRLPPLTQAPPWLTSLPLYPYCSYVHH